MSVAYVSTVDTAAGPFTVVADDDSVLASGWTSTVDDLLSFVPIAPRPQPRADLGAITKAVLAYHEGDLAAIDEIPVRQSGGPFLAHAWAVLRTVPAGEPVTYTEFADLAGRPAAVRAAAMACARNAAALFVPCHRVIRLDGTLGGFRWGLPVKRWLLAHEAPTVTP
jgi:methylated-DNA-[protein]-cysteine S-methyltransferase